MFPLSFSLDHVGPMTRDVEDNAILFEAMAGPDETDPTCLALQPPDCRTTLRDGVRGLRIGIIEHFFRENARRTPEMVAAIMDAAAVLRGLGAEVHPVRLPPLGAWAVAAGPSSRRSNTRFISAGFRRGQRGVLRIGRARNCCRARS